ncbi:gas vesicle protein GvpG [Egicoccus halophilus]|uniref:Gas vesicle protein G n=1 Tax=Egicoccus halophilus TaxID=1670830 RepID=A0A8J3A5S4_9ACTN|nr:gas vesicle protein GvpG [Egicoccus halophilus]GGI03841.1 hypothetical protein GCM10011354_06060 [Egicoccus halophilus]
MIGSLVKLLAAPVTGPWWVVQQVIGAAEAELYDEGRILAALRELSAELDAGRISEEEHAVAEEALLERLVAARARSTQ